jgi:ATP-dependent protease ClpP protease subunit
MSKLRVTPMQLKTKAQFRASLQTDGTLELLVYEDIGENWWDGSGVTAKAVKQQLEANPNYSRIAVRINSPGGDAFEGIAILNLLKAQKRPVNVFIDGIAASAASIIAMAGDTITMGSSAMMMIHNAWTVCMGDGDDMRKCGDTLDRISESVGQAYVDKTGKTAKEVKSLMDAETWMGAQECVDNGFATAVASDSDDDAMALAKSFRSLAKMKHLPEQLKAPKANAEENDGPCICTCGACAEGDCDDCNCTGCDVENCGSTVCDCASGVTSGDDIVEESNLSQYEARLSLLEKV